VASRGETRLAFPSPSSENSEKLMQRQDESENPSLHHWALQWKIRLLEDKPEESSWDYTVALGSQPNVVCGGLGLGIIFLQPFFCGSCRASIPASRLFFF